MTRSKALPESLGQFSIQIASGLYLHNINQSHAASLPGWPVCEVGLCRVLSLAAAMKAGILNCTLTILPLKTKSNGNILACD